MLTFIFLCLRATAASFLSLRDQQSCRWQYNPDATGPKITEVQTQTGWLTWTWHVLSHPFAHTQGGSNHGSFWSAVKAKSIRFDCSSWRAAAVQRVVIFQLVSGWQSAVVCHTVDLEETFRDVMVRVFGSRLGRKTCSRGAKRPCGHTFLNSSSAAYSCD